ncbi:MAG: alpha/beta hydrolase [Oscillospiraceae bacterium]|nr:alpha/beta hydrolase [Oscillospiraceae bacterium]
MKKAEKSRKKAVLELLLVLVIAAAAAFGLYSWQHIMLKKEARLLQERGYQYAMTDVDYALGYRKIGSDIADHIVVTISGMGVDDYAEELAPMIEYLKDDALFVCMDRAGYGLSADTHRPQTVEQVVDDYRSALKNANIEPPYVLLPHSYGGVMATYWESKYPDEIEGVFYMDCTVLSAEEEESAYSALNAWTLRLFSAFGITRMTQKQIVTLPPSYSDTQKENSRLLTLHSFRPYAKDSEQKLMPQNCQTTYESIVTNGIPKAYLSAASFRTAEEWLAADDWTRTWQKMPKATDEERQQLAEKNVSICKNMAEDVIKPYTDLLGNCEILELPGDHFIYMQRPTECAVLFTQFLQRVDEASFVSS